jgi:hypothetical protein
MKSLLTLTGVALITPLVLAAPKPTTSKPSTKTPAKAPAKAPVKKPVKLIREVLGTEALTGYEGSLGETFTIGKEMPMNFTLKKAVYTVGRSNIGGYSQFPKGDEKLLILHFSIQNPRKTAFRISKSYINFKAVDSSGVTRTDVGDIARDVTGESMSYQLQPGQKVDGYTAIKVAAFGEVPKLIVQATYEPKAPIVRYDLRNKVGKLTEPYAEPTDPKGATARKIVPAKQGVFYPVTDLFDVKIDTISYSKEIGKRKADDGKYYCIATATIQNRGPRTANYSQSYFRADLKDVDGEKTNYNTSMLKGSRDEESFGPLSEGETTRVRFYWLLPEGVEAQSVLLRYGYDNEARTFAIEATK